MELFVRFGDQTFWEGEYCHGTNLIHTIAYYSMLFPTVGWPITSALAANLAYLYTLPLCTFFSSLYHNVVIQSTSLQYCNSKWLNKKLNHIKIGLFKIINKVIKVSYRLDLLLKIKIYSVYYIAMLKLVYRNYKSLVYK